MSGLTRVDQEGVSIVCFDRVYRYVRLNSFSEVEAVMISHKIVIASVKAFAYSLVTLVLTTAADLLVFCVEDGCVADPPRVSLPRELEELSVRLRLWSGGYGWEGDEEGG